MQSDILQTWPIPLRFNASSVLLGDAKLPIVVRLDNPRTSKYSPLTGSIYFRHNGRMFLGLFRPFSNGLAIVRVIETEDFELDRGEMICYTPRPLKKDDFGNVLTGKKKVKIQHGTLERVRLDYSEEKYELKNEIAQIESTVDIVDKLAERKKKISEYVRSLAERKRLEKKKNGLDSINTELSEEQLAKITETQRSFLMRGKRYEVAT